MVVYSEIVGNAADSDEWKKKLAACDVETILLDQWTAQKSRFLGKGDKGGEYAVALKRHTQIRDGDIILYAPEKKRAVVLRLELSPVLVIDLSDLEIMDPQTMIRRSVELGHALGNQHWPAVVNGSKVYVPLTVDKKVMLSVMETHHIEGIHYGFQKGVEVLPYLAPHEVRRLFGGAGQESHFHAGHDHSGEHCR
jgi:urease accessory protein